MTADLNQLLAQIEPRWREPDQRVVHFAQQMRANGAQTVLDVGCGSGRHTVHLAQQGFTVYAVDSAATGLAMTADWLKALGLRACLVRADMGDLPFPDATFDAVVSVFAVHHNRLARIRRNVQELGRVLRPGGLCLVDFNSTDTWRYRVDDGLQVEPFTFVPTQGKEAGMPHRYFDEASTRDVLSCLTVHRLWLHEEEVLYRDGIARHHAYWTALVSR